ncbi:MBL fold metallo-hydrolase [bacterium]|jgi:hydroxyacylglutathione hydrolase|nr:MBL fold metallo-hydrolase [bacterium]
MIIKTIQVSPFQQNSRILIDPTSNKVMIIDPGDDISNILNLCDGRLITDIFITHSHIDHVGGLQTLLNKLSQTQDTSSIALYAHSFGRIFRENINKQAASYGLDTTLYLNAPEPTIYLDNKTNLTFGSHTLDLLFTPGHAPGHVALFLNSSVPIPKQQKKNASPTTFDRYEDINFDGTFPILLSGDALFKESIGRTDLPLCNHSELIESIKTKLLVLPENTLVLSGHGPNTTIGHELNFNPFL